MKRSYANKPKSTKIYDYNYNSKYLYNEILKGYISIIEIKRVAHPIVKKIGNNMLRLADTNYTWIQTFPDNKNYSISTMFDTEDNIIEWYIDIVTNMGVDERGIPYYDDLYLDIVALPNNEVFLLDELELEKALKSKDITEKEYTLAKEQVDIILDNVLDDIERLESESRELLKIVRE